MTKPNNTEVPPAATEVGQVEIVVTPAPEPPAEEPEE